MCLINICLDKIYITLKHLKAGVSGYALKREYVPAVPDPERTRRMPQRMGGAAHAVDPRLCAVALHDIEHAVIAEPVPVLGHKNEVSTIRGWLMAVIMNVLIQCFLSGYAEWHDTFPVAFA